MKTANMILQLTSAAIMCALCATAYAQEKPYTEGSVWNISMIRVKPGMLDVYMREVLPLRKKINEEAKKQGIVVSDHVFTGNSRGDREQDRWPRGQAGSADDQANRDARDYREQDHAGTDNQVARLDAVT